MAASGSWIYPCSLLNLIHVEHYASLPMWQCLSVCSRSVGYRWVQFLCGKVKKVHECGWNVPFIFSLNVPDMLSQRQRALSLFISWLSPPAFSPSTSFLYLWHLPLCSSPHMSEPPPFPRAWWTAWEWEEASVSESSKASPISVEWKSTRGIILAFSMPTENRQEERRSKEWARQQTEAE